MVMRITNNMKSVNAQENIFRISEKLNATQERLVTGKKINRPSDDPIGMREILGHRKELAYKSQFIRNSEYSNNFLNQTDSMVEGLQNITNDARVLAVQQANYLPNSQHRLTASKQVNMWIDEALSLAESVYGTRYIFGGNSTALSPVNRNGDEITYVGDNSEVQVEINNGNFVGINLLGSDVFGTDFDADIDSNTLLSDFHRGNGVPAGDISITNTLGNSATITIASTSSVGDVISQINSAGLGVTASINSAADGISLTDSNSNPTQNLVVQDVGSGTTAMELGVIGNAGQTIQGLKAQPAVTASTSVSLLNGGNGMTFSDVRLLNAGASATVTFSNISTVQDIMDAFNNSGMNVNVSLNSVGNALSIASTTSGSTPVVMDIGTGTTASGLGLGGARNYFATLAGLKQALENNDNLAIAALAENLGTVSANLSGLRGTVGARANMINSTVSSLLISKENSNELVAITENDDFADSATQLAALETALNASLSTTARILQPSLVDFLR